jgi:hypothetical protein
MPKFKPGLHKDVPTIFDGVPMPEADGDQPPTRQPSWQRTDPGIQRAQSSRSAGTAEGTPSHLTPTPAHRRTDEQGAHAPTGPGQANQEKVYTETTIGPQPQQGRRQQIKNKLVAPKPGVGTKRRRTMTMLVPVLSIVLVFVLVRVFGIPSLNSGGSTATDEETTTELSVDSDYKINWQIPKPYPATLRDPMKFNVKTDDIQVEAGELIVKGIVYAEDQRSAIIGTEIVHEGDIVSGAVVVKINLDSVELERNAKRWVQKVQ